MNKENKIQVIILLFSLAGSGLVLVGTGLHGLGISLDSVYFISTARNLLSGKGYVYWAGFRVVDFPPLYPLLLAIIGLAGIKPLTGARYLNVLLFGVIVFLAGRLFKKHLKSEKLIILGTAAVLLSHPLLYVSVMALTECLFSCLILLFLFYLPAFLEQPSKKTWISVCLVTILACLQKYVGISLIISGFISITLFLRDRPFRERLKQATIYGVVCGLPTLIWLAGNYLASSTLIGRRPPSHTSVYRNFHKIVEVVSSWFIPHQIPFNLRLAIFLSVLALLTAIFHRRPRRKDSTRNLAVRAAAIWVSVYFLSLLITASLSEFYFLRGAYRYCVPAFLPVLFLLLVKTDETFASVKPEKIKKIIIGIICIWLLYPLTRTAHSLWNLSSKGTGYHLYWKNSPTIDWLLKNPLKGDIYSNKPEVLYLFLDRPAHFIYLFKWNTVRFKDSPRKKYYLVWLNQHGGRNSYGEKKAGRLLKLQKLQTFADGKIFLIRPNQ